LIRLLGRPYGQGIEVMFLIIQGGVKEEYLVIK